MIRTNRRQQGIPYAYIWFADRPTLDRAFLPTVYMNCKHLGSVAGYIRSAQYTKLIDLRQSPEELLASFGKNTSYKIRRAEREGVTLQPVESPEAFVSFFNAFAASKGLSTTDEGQFLTWGSSTLGFAAFDGQEQVVMHSYIVDREASRARLLHSASLFRNVDDSKERNAIGRANRLLHFKAMMLFAEQGFDCYDFGGYAMDTEDRDLVSINRFKDEFGGELAEESSYLSYPMFLIKALRGNLSGSV